MASLLVWAPPSRADQIAGPGIEDLDLESLLTAPAYVWAATKTAQKTSEAPAIISTITREQIAIWGYQSVADVLSHVLGFYVVDDHTAPNLAVRGISGGLYADSSIIKVLIDGHPVAFQSSSGNWLGPELVPLSAVERIEVVRGPASALFGADAFLGVVNIQTRAATDVGGVHASLGIGYNGRAPATDVDVAAGTTWGDFEVLLSGRHNTQDLSGLSLPTTSPAPSIPEYNLGATQASDLQQASSVLLLRTTYRPTPGTALSAFGYYSALRRDIEFGSFHQLVNGVNQEGVQSGSLLALSQARAGLLWEQDLAANLRFSVRAAMFRGAPGKDNRLEVGSDFYYVRREFAFRGAEGDGQVEWTPGAIDSLKLVVGASAFADDEQLPSRIGVAKVATQDGRQPGDTIADISVAQGRKTFVNVGSYAQGIWRTPLEEKLNVTGGVRYDWHNIYGGQTSGRLGLVSSPFPRLYTKLLFGSAFKAPSPALLHAIPSAVGDVVGNPALRPQYVRTVELELSGDPGENLNLSSNVAYSLLTDKAEFVQQGIDMVARNVSRAQTWSWESRAELRTGGWLRSHLSLELQRTSRRTGQSGYSAAVVGTAGGIYPEVMVHSGLVLQPPESPLIAAVQASYIGSRHASDTNILLNASPYDLPAYWLLEATLSTVGFELWGSGHEVAFTLTGKNLLGARGPTPGFSGVDYPLAPRTFLLHTTLSL